MFLKESRNRLFSYAQKVKRKNEKSFTKSVSLKKEYNKKVGGKQKITACPIPRPLIALEYIPRVCFAFTSSNSLLKRYLVRAWEKSF